ALVNTYAADNATTNVSVNMFSPGPTRTRMRAQAMPGEDPNTVPSADEVAAQLVAMCLPAFKDKGAIYKYAPTGLFKFKP
ncbi:MAG: oxidoreductase, partial [Parvibaculaceae bacterium]